MSHNNAHDFFKKFNTLFEGKEVKETAEDDFSKKRANKRAAEEEAWAKSKGTPKKEAKEVKEGWSDEMTDDEKDQWENKQCQADDKRNAAREDAACKELAKAKKEQRQAEKGKKKEVKEGWSDENPDLDKGEEMEKAQCQADDKRKADKEDAACKALDKADKAKKDKKASNVKETASEFYRRYADIVNEAFGDDDEEDPDVAKADKVKGKDGATQSDAEKKLPPWLQKKDAFAKKDKKSEDKGAATTKKEKMESIQKEISDLEYQKAAKAINEAEQVNELSPDTMKSYASKRAKDLLHKRNHSFHVDDTRDSDGDSLDADTQRMKKGLKNVEKKTGTPALSSVPMPSWRKKNESMDSSDVDRQRRMGNMGDDEGDEYDPEQIARKKAAPDKPGYHKMIHPVTGKVLYVKDR